MPYRKQIKRTKILFFNKLKKLSRDKRGTAGSSNRDISTNAYVGIMYVSDFLYTFAKEISNSGSSSSWINSTLQWTICTSGSSANGAYYFGSTKDSLTLGYNGSFFLMHDPLDVRPTVYLKSTTKIKSGTRAQNDPYILLEE